MIDFITKSVNGRMVTAFFDTREAAQRAAESLQALGVRSGRNSNRRGRQPGRAELTPASRVFGIR